MNILKSFIIGFVLSLSGVGALSAAGAAALPLPASPTTASVSTDAACDGLGQIDAAQGCASPGSGQSTITGIIRAVISILSYIVGIVAVIMVIVAGFKYTKSGGDSNNVSSAKNTLIYALVGLSVAVLAQTLVHFAFSTAANTSTACPYTVKDPNGTVLTGITSGDPLCKR